MSLYSRPNLLNVVSLIFLYLFWHRGSAPPAREIQHQCAMLGVKYISPIFIQIGNIILAKLYIFGAGTLQ